jgi:hypothetical protein
LLAICYYLGIDALLGGMITSIFLVVICYVAIWSVLKIIGKIHHAHIVMTIAIFPIMFLMVVPIAMGQLHQHNTISCEKTERLLEEIPLTVTTCKFRDSTDDEWSVESVRKVELTK